MKIAIVGGGVSGLVAAHLLHRRHEVTVFEAADRLGGHAWTVAVLGARGTPVSVDLGFLVFNERMYPLFSRLIAKLGISSHASPMSFSVRREGSDFEYAGNSLRTLFARKRNLVSPSFYRMLTGILRFHRAASGVLEDDTAEQTVGAYLENSRYSPSFVDDYLVPLSASLWSCPAGQVKEIPIRFLVAFLSRHGMLQLRNRPEWRTILGGSERYVNALVAPFRDRIRLNAPVRRVRRAAESVHIETEGGIMQPFDHVILACHADQTLRLLVDADQEETSQLSAFPFQRNEVVLHDDTRVLPRRTSLWSSWNYFIPSSDEQGPVRVTYDLNRLQGVIDSRRFLVTLNGAERVDPTRTLRHTSFEHPMFGVASQAAQRRSADFLNRRRTSFCGAWTGFGFHEDGVRSAEAVARALGGESIR